jgi:formylglycine-generating enzyme required for sulfatase activity
MNPKNMVWVSGGAFLMGSNDFYPEEMPVHRARIGGFWMDEHPVTVAEFRRFIKATGHITVAEMTPDPADFPAAEPGQLVPGSLVFTPPDRPVPLDDFRHWWSWVPGAQWRHPEGPGSTLHGLEQHPVTHVAYPDALAYAEWAGKALSTEAEWEFAARGGLEGATYAWGDEFAPSPCTTTCSTATRARRRLASSRPTATASSTSRAMCGSGRRTTTRAATHPLTTPQRQFNRHPIRPAAAGRNSSRRARNLRSTRPAHRRRR